MKKKKKKNEKNGLKFYSFVYKIFESQMRINKRPSSINKIIIIQLHIYSLIAPNTIRYAGKCFNRYREKCHSIFHATLSVVIVQRSWTKRYKL